MTSVGCTGHQGLSETTRQLICEALDARLSHLSPSSVDGFCSLAVGADQLFAQSVLASDGRLHVIVPCARYIDTFTTPSERKAYLALLSAAESTEELPFAEPTEEAFMAAGRRVVERSDLLLAVWDGEQAAGLGGTADVVAYAVELGRPVEVIWPEGSLRE